jgi:Na+-driven multidrug efflux pump
MKQIISSLKSINYKLFSVLFLMGLIPTIYSTLRIFFLGEMPDSYSFSIAAQLQWVNLIYEILQEAFILPLYFLIGKAFLNSPSSKANYNIEFTNRIKTGLIVVFGIYSILSLFLIIFAKSMIEFMQQDISIISETVRYIRLETVSAIFGVLVKFATVVLVTIKKEKYLYSILLLQMFLTIFFDFFFISTLNFSLNLGVDGIAITNIIVNFLLLFLAVIFLQKEKINIFSKTKLNFSWTKDLLKVGGISGLESFVRNIAFMLMIVRMVNVVGEQGTFWVANNFIWGWVLLPVIQLGELIKRDCAEFGKDAIKQKTCGYFTLTTIFVLLWFVTLPLWKPFMRDVLNLDNYSEVYFIVLISVGFYVLFAFNNVIDSIFYGIGKTNYMLFQSLAVNTLFYGTMFVLYIVGVYEPTLVKIALMFAIGTAIDSVLTFGIFVCMCRNHRYKFSV